MQVNSVSNLFKFYNLDQSENIMLSKFLSKKNFIVLTEIF